MLQPEAENTAQQFAGGFFRRADSLRTHSRRIARRCASRTAHVDTVRGDFSAAQITLIWRNPSGIPTNLQPPPSADPENQSSLHPHRADLLVATWTGDAADEKRRGVSPPLYPALSSPHLSGRPLRSITPS